MQDDKELNIIIRQHIADRIKEDIDWVSSAIPDNEFWALSIYTILLPAIFKEIGHIILPEPQEIGIAWNYIDGSLCVIYGLYKLFNAHTHLTLVDKIKGLMNVGSGAQLLALTTISASVLGPIGFAAAAGAALVLSCIDWAHATRRSFDPEYWLSDSKAELNTLKDHIKNLTEQKTNLEKYNDDVIGAMNESWRMYMLRWTLKKKEQRIESLEQRQIYLEKGIKHLETQKENNELLSFTPEMQEQCLNERRKASFNTLIYSLVFVGMVLSCIPGMQIPALVFIAAATALFIWKYGPIIKEKLTAVKEKLTNMKKSDPKDDDDPRLSTESTIRF